MNARRRLHIVLTISLLLCCGSTLGAIPRCPWQNSKTKRGRPHDWPPLQTSYSREEFVGAEACAECHPSEFASQKMTAMARAAHPLIGASQPALACRLGRYIFRIAPQAGRLSYSVSHGRRTISEPILEVFGSGSIGQTYVYIHRGKYYEGKVSYYSAAQGLDITASHRRFQVQWTRPSGENWTWAGSSNASVATTQPQSRTADSTSRR
jgi:hypothetical protein